MNWSPNERYRRGDDIILGKDVGNILEEAIREAKERILVSSPLIEERYVDILIKKALEGVKVFVITSDDEDNDGRFIASVAKYYKEEKLREAEKDVAEWKFRRRRDKLVMAGIITLFVVAAMLAFAISFYFTAYALYLRALAGGLALLSFFYYFFIGKKKIKEAEKRAAIAEYLFKKTSESVKADREKIKSNLAVLVVPRTKAYVHAKLYVIDDRAWAGSPNLTPSGLHKNYELLMEIDASKAEKKFMELWNELIEILKSPAVS
ncbi:MAG: hypothetical protein JZD41_02500 [Thermoproteus sp.]|nr:hypothetical protein [Thermoproteus sp.]